MQYTSIGDGKVYIKIPFHETLSKVELIIHDSGEDAAVTTVTGETCCHPIGKHFIIIATIPLRA